VKSGVEIVRWTLNAFELLALLAGLWRWRLVRHTYWRWLVIFLAVVLCNELLGKYFGYRHIPNANPMLYRYLAPIRFAILFWLLLQPLNWKPLRPMVLVCTLYGLVFLAEEWYLPISYAKGSGISIFFACLVIIWLSLSFLGGLVQSRAILNFKTNMHFWFSVGLLLFYAVFMPFHTGRRVLNELYPGVFLFYWYVQMVAACGMFVCFSILFIWGKPK
jgi:hypothetical protein